MTIESILGSQFKCQVKEMVNFSKYDAVIPVVRGNATLGNISSGWIPRILSVLVSN